MKWGRVHMPRGRRDFTRKAHVIRFLTESWDIECIMNWEGRSHKTVSAGHNFWRERRAEAESNRGPSAYQHNALPLGLICSRAWSHPSPPPHPYLPPPPPPHPSPHPTTTPTSLCNVTRQPGIDMQWLCGYVFVQQAEGETVVVSACRPTWLLLLLFWPIDPWPINHLIRSDRRQGLRLHPSLLQLKGWLGLVSSLNGEGGGERI